MHKNSTTRIRPNTLMFGTPATEQYMPAAQKQSWVQPRPSPPFQDRTNQMLPAMGEGQGVNVELIGYEAGQGECVAGRGRVVKREGARVGVMSGKAREGAREETRVLAIEELDGDHLEEAYQGQDKVLEDGKREAAENGIGGKADKQQWKPYLEDKCQIMGQQQPEHPVSRNRKNIFNISLSSQSGTDQQQQVPQPTPEPTHKVAPLQKSIEEKKETVKDTLTQHQEQPPTISLESLTKHSSIKFRIQLSDTDSNQQQHVESATPASPAVCKKFLLAHLDSSDSDCSEIGPNSNTLDDADNMDSLEIVHSITINKLQLLHNAQNAHYLSFCPVPYEHKLSLVIRRDQEKSTYTVYDGQGVGAVMRVQRELGGVYKFYALQRVRSGKNNEEKVELLGKMKSNFIGTQFNCYVLKEGSKEKYHTVSIEYEVNILGFNGPRKCRLYTAQTALPGDSTVIDQHSNVNGHPSPNINVYHSKQPKWMPQLNAYVLNLRGTATHSSIKNCILVEEGNEGKEVLIFGKKGKDIFNMEIKHPMTVVQGVAFAVSSFQKKLACE